MTSVQQGQNSTSPAQSELAPFAFLIGCWECKAKLQTGDGLWETFSATWLGRFILDGHAIVDEYKMTDGKGAVIVYGMNFRSFDAEKSIWHVKWLNALTGTWTDLAPSTFGGVSITGPTITYAFREPAAAHAYTRATYTKASNTHFTWRGEKSEDRSTWREFMIVDCHRRKM